jgi:hypothetical protein
MSQYGKGQNCMGASAFAPLQTAFANFNRPASGVRSAGNFAYSSQGCQPARELHPIKIFFLEI